MIMSGLAIFSRALGQPCSSKCSNRSALYRPYVTVMVR